MQNRKSCISQNKAHLITKLLFYFIQHSPATLPGRSAGDIINKNKIRQGVLDCSIPSAVVNSDTTSNVGTKKNEAKQAYIPTGKCSSKIFQLPDGAQTPASDVCLLHCNICQPEKDVHIVPNIPTNLLISTAKLAEAGYKTVFNDEKVNVYNASNTKVIVTRQVILRGWLDKDANLYRIPLVPIILNNNTNTVLVRKPPTKFLPDCLPPTEAVHANRTGPVPARGGRISNKTNMDSGDKKQTVCIMARLNTKTIAKHHSESKETMKGHEQKGQSGLRSTKTKEPTSEPTAETDSNNKQAHQSPNKYDVFIKVFSAEEEGNATTFANQTGRFPKKSSNGKQYIMVLVLPGSNGILQEPMKNRTAGKMIRLSMPDQLTQECRDHTQTPHTGQ
jgi:hypothetical protein